MDNEHKKEIINRLVKDGAIDFNEALELWETEKETVYIPQYPLYSPYINPNYPTWHVPPFIITDCGTTCNNESVVGNVVNFTGKELISFTN